MVASAPPIHPVEGGRSRPGIDSTRARLRSVHGRRIPVRSPDALRHLRIRTGERPEPPHGSGDPQRSGPLPATTEPSWAAFRRRCLGGPAGIPTLGTSIRHRRAANACPVVGGPLHRVGGGTGGWRIPRRPKADPHPPPFRSDPPVGGIRMALRGRRRLATSVGAGAFQCGRVASPDGDHFRHLPRPRRRHRLPSVFLGSLCPARGGPPVAAPHPSGLLRPSGTASIVTAHQRLAGDSGALRIDRQRSTGNGRVAVDQRPGDRSESR